MTILTEEEPTGINRDYGRRQYVDADPVATYVDSMRRVTDKAMFNQALGKQSELKKPYQAESFEEMEHFYEKQGVTETSPFTPLTLPPSPTFDVVTGEPLKPFEPIGLPVITPPTITLGQLPPVKVEDEPEIPTTAPPLTPIDLSPITVPEAEPPVIPPPVIPDIVTPVVIPGPTIIVPPIIVPTIEPAIEPDPNPDVIIIPPPIVITKEPPPVVVIDEPPFEPPDVEPPVEPPGPPDVDPPIEPPVIPIDQPPVTIITEVDPPLEPPVPPPPIPPPSVPPPVVVIVTPIITDITVPVPEEPDLPPITPPEPPFEVTGDPPVVPIPPGDAVNRTIMTVTLPITAAAGATIVGTGTIDSWLTAGFWEWEGSSSTPGIEIAIRVLGVRGTQVEITVKIDGSVTTQDISIVTTAKNTISTERPSALSVVSVSSVNLIPNGDMELDSDWTDIDNANNYAAQSNAIVFRGSFSWRFAILNPTFGAASTTFRGSNFSLVSGITYDFSVYYYSVTDFTSIDEGQIRIGIIGTNIPTSVGRVIVGSFGNFPLVVGAWTKITHSFVSPSNISNARAQFNFFPEGSNDWPVLPNVHFDDAILTASDGVHSGSAEINSPNKHVSVPDSADWAFGTNPFTIDFWFRKTSVIGPGLANMFEQKDVADFWEIEVAVDGTSLASSMKIGGVFRYNLSGAVSLSVDTWYHVALIRGWAGNANTFALTLDGSLVDSQTVASGIEIGDLASVLKIGESSTGGPSVIFGGHIDEVRISDVTRWSSTFTPDSSPYTVDGNTLLLLHMNGVNGSTLFQDASGKHSPTSANNAAVDTSVFKF